MGANTPNASRIENGKLFQTVELETGSYRFDFWVHRSEQPTVTAAAFVVAALGDDLPDANNVPQEALGFFRLPRIAANSDIQYSFNFELAEKATTSLGFVVNSVDGGNTQILFSRVALWKLVE